jgi:hypothetical protein
MTKPIKISLFVLIALAVGGGGFWLFRKVSYVDFKVLEVDKVRTTVKISFRGQEYTFSYLEENAAVVKPWGKVLTWTLNVSKNKSYPGLMFSILRNGKLVRTEQVSFI